MAAAVGPVGVRAEVIGVGHTRRVGEHAALVEVGMRRAGDAGVEARVGDVHGERERRRAEAERLVKREVADAGRQQRVRPDRVSGEQLALHLVVKLRLNVGVDRHDARVGRDPRDLARVGPHEARPVGTDRGLRPQRRSGVVDLRPSRRPVVARERLHRDALRSAGGHAGAELVGGRERDDRAYGRIATQLAQRGELRGRPRVDEVAVLRHVRHDACARRVQPVQPHVLDGSGELDDDERRRARKAALAAERGAFGCRVQRALAEAHLAHVVAQVGAGPDEACGVRAVRLDERERVVARDDPRVHRGERARRLARGRDDDEVQIRGRRARRGTERTDDQREDERGHGEGRGQETCGATSRHPRELTAGAARRETLGRRMRRFPAPPSARPRPREGAG